MRNIKAVFVGFGEINTPREMIESRSHAAADQLREQGIDLAWIEPVRDDPEGQDVERARKEITALEFDLLVICVAGWIPTHAVISVIEPFKHSPMLLWGLTGWQEGDRFITTADQAGTTALRKPMQDMGYTFKYVVNYCGTPPRMDKLMSYAKAARAVALLKNAKIGMMGFRDMRLYGTLYDGVSLKGKIGPEIETFEMLEMVQAIEKLNEKDVTELVNNVRNRWQFVKEPQSGTIENVVKLYLAIRDKIHQRAYEAMSLLDVDGVKKLMGFSPAGVFMLLHEEEDICTVPENDCMGAVTQLITRYLTGQVAAYLEFYEFMEDGVLMGVPDYVPTEIVDGPVTVMPTSFGEFGEGLLNVSKVKTGEVTIARLGYVGNEYSMHIATGNAAAPRKWEEAGWDPPAPQLPSLEIKLDCPMDDFTQKVMGQHYIISYGNHREDLEDLCRILDITVY
jgi:L-fucose isomerase-like protein